MSFHQGNESQSIWTSDIQEASFPILREDLVVDACIVGAGIGGLMTAYLLAKEGKSVCVLEAAPRIGAGQSGRTTAQLCLALDRPYAVLRKYHGAEGVRRIVQSHRAALDRVEEIAKEENIECDLRRLSGYLFLGSETPARYLEAELEVLHKAGLESVRLREGLPVDFFDPGACLEFPNQIEFNPMKFMIGLADRLRAMGVKIFTESPVVVVRGGLQAYVQTNTDATIAADSLVVATNTPINNLFAVHTKQAPYRTYVVGYAVDKNLLSGLYWDTESPAHYLRVVRTEGPKDILLVGGEDHKTGHEDDPRGCFLRLEDWVERRFPVAGKPLWRWSGQIMQSMDGLAYLGHNPADEENVYIISGDSGNGMTHAVIGAMLITDQIQGRMNPWEEIYSPDRFNMRAAGTFFSDNAAVAKVYTDWLRRDSPDVLSELPIGEGTVVNQGLRKIAVYRDDRGDLHFLSAACPHLAGVVRWNPVEKSWDCPCHGSRFDKMGRVIEGPAMSSLTPISLDVDTSNPESHWIP